MTYSIAISCGEVSGDIHGANLAQALKQLLPDAKLWGIGSRRMREAGVAVKFDISPHNAVGILENLRHLPDLAFINLRFQAILRRRRPDLLILIDSQGFNMPLAQRAKKLGIPTLYFFAPQEWLWGTKDNGQKAATVLTKIAAVFPEEFSFYKSLGADVQLIGHPIIDWINNPAAKNIRARQAVNSKTLLIALLPGSRWHEINRLLPTLLKTARIIAKHLAKKEKFCQFFIPAATEKIYHRLVKMKQATNLPLLIVPPAFPLPVKGADLAIAASGTVTLELAAQGIPTVVFYKLSVVTEFIALKILKAKLPPFISLPNLILNEKILPEFTQAAASPENLAQAALAILEYPEQQQKIKAKLSGLNQKLGDGGVYQRLAKIVQEMLLKH